MTAARRRLIVTDIREHFSVSQRRACRALDLPRSSLRYAPVDECTRECLALEARRGMTAEEIQVILVGVAAQRGGPPHRVRSDNGPEFAATVVRSWLEGTGSGALYVAPASPWQNGYAESFHSKLRDEFLDLEEFEDEPQARALGALWREEYNTERPHSSLGYRTPAEYAATCVRYVPIEENPIEPLPTEQPHP